MSQVNVLKILVGILIVMNAGLIIFFFNGPGRRMPPGGGPENFRNIVIRELQLDDRQQEDYLRSARAHREGMNRLERDQAELTRAYFDGLKSGTQSGGRDSLLAKIQAIEASKVELTYRHFDELKAICREDQLGHFPRILDRALNLMLLKRRKAPPHPGRPG